MPSEPSTVLVHTCTRCGHTWLGRTPGKPVRCASCKSPYWDRPRTPLGGTALTRRQATEDQSRVTPLSPAHGFPSRLDLPSLTTSTIDEGDVIEMVWNPFKGFIPPALSAPTSSIVEPLPARDTAGLSSEQHKALYDSLNMKEKTPEERWNIYRAVAARATEIAQVEALAKDESERERQREVELLALEYQKAVFAGMRPEAATSGYQRELHKLLAVEQAVSGGLSAYNMPSGLTLQPGETYVPFTQPVQLSGSQAVFVGPTSPLPPQPEPYRSSGTALMPSINRVDPYSKLETPVSKYSPACIVCHLNYRADQLDSKGRCYACTDEADTRDPVDPEQQYAVRQIAQTKQQKAREKYERKRKRQAILAGLQR